MAVTRLVELGATAERLTWRLPYFLFSIERLDLVNCELGCGGLVELGRYARENRNLLGLGATVSVTVTGDAADVSVQRWTEARRRSRC